MSQTSTITTKQALDWLSSGQAVLVDVREPAEFSAAHIPYAMSAPLAGAVAVVRGLQLSPETRIIFQCQKGGRGSQACAALGSVGPGGQSVFNLEGGIEAWTAAGLPVVSNASAPPISIFRQVQMIVGGLVAVGVVIGFSLHPAGFVVAGLFGAALAISGISGWCGLGLLLNHAPWNRPSRH